MNPNMFRFGSEILGGTAVQSSILGTELTNYGRYSVFEDVQILDV